MNAKTDEIIAKVKAKAVQAASYTAHKAGEFYDNTKLNFKLYELNGAVDEAKQKIGEIVYSAHKGEMTDQNGLDELLTEIDAKSAEIAEIKHTIAERKQKPAE